ncbi:MAG: hypothetical protein U1E21_09385 [Reyranellaceae bacterium]
MARNPLIARPPLIVSKDEVVGAVETAMDEDPGPKSIAIRRNDDGTYTITVEFE